MDYKIRSKVKQILLDEKVPVDSEVTILGLVRTLRGSKKIKFIEINDGSCVQNIQGVIDNPQNFPNIDDILTGAAVRMRGKLVESQGKGQKYEILVSELDLIGPADASYPLQKKEHTREFLREIAHLRPRTRTFGAMARIRSKLAHAIHSYYQDRGFIWVPTPIITASDCEGAGELFRVSVLDPKKPPVNEKGEVDWDQDFFAHETYLTVSGQLEGELFAAALGDIYTFGPTFRAENSNTARHAAEFWMVEPEMAWVELDDNMDLAEDFLKALFAYALEKCPEEMDFFSQRTEEEIIKTLEGVVDSKFERITYTEAVAILEKSGHSFEYPISWGVELQTEHERYLTEKAFKKPVIVYDYPKEIKAFYMRLNDDDKTVAALDVLVPRVGEIIGGSQREERYDILHQRMSQLGLDNLDDYSWYFDIRRYGTMPHGGFGLGFERALMYITGVGNIRDVLPFPRVPRWARF